MKEVIQLLQKKPFVDQITVNKWLRVTAIGTLEQNCN